MKTLYQLSTSQKNTLLEHYRKQQKQSRYHQVLYLSLAACLILAFCLLTNLKQEPNSINSDLVHAQEIENQIDEIFTMHKGLKKIGVNQKSRNLSSNLQSPHKKSLSSRLRKSKQKLKSIKQKLT